MCPMLLISVPDSSTRSNIVFDGAAACFPLALRISSPWLNRRTCIGHWSIRKRSWRAFCRQAIDPVEERPAPARTSIVLPAAPPSLHRRARHRAVRAKHAAVARFRPQPLAAARANVEKPARIGRHRFRGPVSALRTGDRRLQHHRTKLARKADQATLHAFALPGITNAIMLRQHTERGDQNALRALLSNGPPAPALPQRPFANGCLHADDVPDA